MLILFEKKSKFLISDPINLYGANLNSQRANMSKKNPFWKVVFANLRVKPQFLPDFRVQGPKKPIVDQIWCSPVIIQPNPYFDWSTMPFQN